MKTEDIFVINYKQLSGSNKYYYNVPAYDSTVGGFLTVLGRDYT